MRAVVQRVKQSTVQVDNETVGAIGPGLLVLLGVAREDETGDADFLAEKVSNLRIFQDSQGKMNLSLIDTGGEMLVVSQFTLLADCRKGRRPSFVDAAGPDKADELYRYFVAQVQSRGLRVQTGRFGAMMTIDLTNDGPVTLVVESK
jgi:D-tyrosyl-tRNA(Tyr) deacylase